MEIRKPAHGIIGFGNGLLRAINRGETVGFPGGVKVRAPRREVPRGPHWRRISKKERLRRSLIPIRVT